MSFCSRTSPAGDGAKPAVPEQHWIATFFGRVFYPLDPNPEDILIEDIAHALSNLCRFSGHVKQFYSVAEHSVRVFSAMQIVEGITDPEVLLWGLMHDASEAYLVDLPSPIKRHSEIGRHYRIAEEKLTSVIARHYHLTPDTIPDIVKRYDTILLMTEKRDLFPNLPVKPWEDVEKPLGAAIDPWGPAYAKTAFLSSFKSLMLRRMQRDTAK